MVNFSISFCQFHMLNTKDTHVGAFVQLHRPRALFYMYVCVFKPRDESGFIFLFLSGIILL